MKNKINSRFMAITAIAIVFTVIMTTIVYYKLFQQEVMDDLISYAHIIEETNIFGKDENYEFQNFHLDTKKIRITVVRPDGSVAYDTQADVTTMDNHKNRPEIQKALEQGEGKTIRTSSTIKKSNFYYAVRMENGNVLRVAKETGSIWSVYCSVFPVILLISGILFWVCYLLGHYLTKSLIAPIEQMAGDLDHLDRVSTYKELMPFINLIRTQHEDILKSAKMRQEFTANVSHELKTPLTSISGYSELIENGMATEKDVTRFAGEIHRNAKRLLSLINDIIKLSELDASSEHQITMEEVDLYAIAQACVSMVEPSAAKHGVTLHLSGESTVITANKDMIEELVYNLCDNAIRYNHEGGNVWVDVGEQLTVSDDGIGISKENQERIFERFFRVDKSRSKKTGGTGLGLAIVKHIVELHEAQLQLESQEGRGTKICVVFHK
ncbi:MAG: ATP-binding protein [Lachnospiraceae bacterium]|nr:ATP-binding protein [Lachnospiraceae bacterium]